MVKCQAWRYVPESGDGESLPGRNRRAWRPCREQALPGCPACQGCVDAASAHPARAIRKLVAEMPGVPDDILAMLTTDMSVEVSHAARRAWRERNQQEQ